MYAVMYYRKSGNNLYQNTRIGTKKSVKYTRQVSKDDYSQEKTRRA